MKIGNKKELKSIAEDPYSFMMVDTRPNARVTFKKNFDEPIKNFTF